MLSAYRRHGLVIALALVAGLTSAMVRPQAHSAALPAVAHVVAGTRWKVVAAYTPGGWTGMTYQQWLLRNTENAQATLYVGAASEVQKMVHWSGELGYQGQGYQVLRSRRRSIQLRDGTSAPISVVTVQHLSDRELLAYAVVSPDGISARPTDNLLRVAWDTLRGASGPYYLVRVAVVPTRGDQVAEKVAEQLLLPVLSVLNTDVRSSTL